MMDKDKVEHLPRERIEIKLPLNDWGQNLRHLAMHNGVVPMEKGPMGPLRVSCEPRMVEARRPCDDVSVEMGSGAVAPSRERCIPARAVSDQSFQNPLKRSGASSV
jgi:hypothetical protein